MRLRLELGVLGQAGYVRNPDTGEEYPCTWQVDTHPESRDEDHGGVFLAPASTGRKVMTIVVDIPELGAPVLPRKLAAALALVDGKEQPESIALRPKSA